MSDKDKVFTRKIKQIEDYLNKEIYDRCIKWENSKNTSRKLKKEIMNIAWGIFYNYAWPYRFSKTDDIEDFKTRGYRGIDSSLKFCVEMRSGNKYIDIIISNLNVNLKKTGDKIGKSYIYEVTDNSFDLTKLELDCRAYNPHRIWINDFKFNMDLTLKENFDIL